MMFLIVEIIYVSQTLVIHIYECNTILKNLVMKNIWRINLHNLQRFPDDDEMFIT